jgi:hypothetical protein
MGLVLWGLALGSAEVLPRVGYAKTESGNPPPWWCAGR